METKTVVEIQEEGKQEVSGKKEENVNALKRKLKVIGKIVGDSITDNEVSDVAWKTGIVVGTARAVKTKSLRTGIGSMYNVTTTIFTANVIWNIATNFKKIKDA